MTVRDEVAIREAEQVVIDLAYQIDLIRMLQCLRSPEENAASLKGALDNLHVAVCALNALDPGEVEQAIPARDLEGR